MAPLALTLALAAPAGAQTGSYGNGNSSASVSSSEIQRLQDDVYSAGGDVSRARSRDAALADRLQNQLDDLRDEVTYLKVKLRREGSVSRNDYNDVRDRIQNVRAEARGSQASSQSSPSNNPAWSTNSGSASGYGSGSGAGYGSGQSQSQSQGQGGYSGGTQDAPHPARQSRTGEVPAGQELDVRLERELSSATAQVEDRFTATTAVDLYQGNDVLIPAGSTLRGVVSSVDKATRTDRKGSMTLAFDQITIRGRAYQMHGTVEQALESEGMKGEVGKIGAGAGVGAVLGGILGGAKGALLGILIGGGGTIAATPGKDVTLPSGTILRVKIDQPIQVR
jgi:hypothetical protein